ncbi:MAG: cation:proton antiporter, partial [Anaerolineae bacterium]
MPDLSTLIELLLIALAVAMVTQRTRRPYTIALVIWGLILGLLQLIEPIHLSKELVLTIFLPPLLFEGALHIRAKILRRRAGLVFGLALGGTLLTALIIGAAVHLLLGFDLLTGLLLGAIIAPTDPVSVLATFRAARVDRDLSTIVESESLFNDGIAVVLYVILLKTLDGMPLNPVHTIGDFALVIVGGGALGLGLGILTVQLLRRHDDHLVEVMTTLVVVYGTYLLAEHLHLSGVIAVAVAGLVVGNYGLS